MARTNSCTCRPARRITRVIAQVLADHHARRRLTPWPDPVASLDEIRALLAHLPGPDLEAGSAAASRDAQLTKPAGALGRLEELADWLATWQGRHPPTRRSSAHRRLCRQSRRRGARRLGLSRRGDGADGAEFHRRRRRGQPALPGRRRRSARLRDEPRPADRRHRRGAGDERGGMRARHRLRHDGGRAGHRRARGRRDGDRQHDHRGGAVPRRSSAARRPSGPGPAPASPAPRSRRSARWSPPRSPATSRRRATRSSCCAAWAGSNSRRSPARSWRRGWGGSRSCSTASARPPPLPCSTPPTRGRSTIASPGTSRPSPGTAASSSGSASRRSSISACASAKPPGATLAIVMLKAAAACHSGMATFADAGVSGPSNDAKAAAEEIITEAERASRRPGYLKSVVGSRRSCSLRQNV